MTDDKTFEELRNAAIKIWQTYDNTYGYADEKINYLKSFGNVSDNYGTIIGMFDDTNQAKLYAMVGDEAKSLITNWTGGAYKMELFTIYYMNVMQELDHEIVAHHEKPTSEEALRYLILNESVGEDYSDNIEVYPTHITDMDGERVEVTL